MRRLSRRQRIAAVVLVVVAAAFLTLDLAGSSLRLAHGGVRGALGALYRGTDSVLGPVRRFVAALPAATSNQHKVQTLQQENLQLRQRLANSQVDRNTAAQLHRLQLAAAAGGYRVLPARVLATSSAEGFDYTVTLDVGSSNDVRVGQTVIDGQGLVGRVLHADASSSVVLLAIDPESGVGARDARTGQLGVATGRGRSGFTFRPLDPAARLRAGDPIWTGPAGRSSFVANLSVGTVQSVRLSADGSTSATVVPTVSASALDVVGVVVVGGQRTTTRAPLQPSHLASGR